MMYFDIEPVGKPRMTQRDKFAPSDAALRYYAFKDELNYRANLQRFRLGKVVDLIFFIGMPASWSAQKKAEMRFQSHEQKPDFDNLVKAFCDALADNDAAVWCGSVKKYWNTKGGILVVRNVAESGRFDARKLNIVIIEELEEDLRRQGVIT